MSRIHWNDLPTTVRRAIESQVGGVTKAETVSEGRNSAIAMLLMTAEGTVFAKGLRGAQARTQQREIDINPYVRPIAPRLLWSIEVDEWVVLGFEHIAGRHADLSPASPDLPRVTAALKLLGQIRCPDLPLKRIEQRFAGYAEGAPVNLLSGNNLLHTDLNPGNILIDDSNRARLVDWAWPTRGAAWIDPACLTLWLISEGHTSQQAEEWALQFASWRSAPKEAIDTFALANCNLWEEIAHDNPQPWQKQMAQSAREWWEYRRSR